MKKRRLVSALLVVIFVLFALSIPGAAVSETPDGEHEVVFSTTAGSNGSYHYDVETGVETYIPPDATLEECGIDLDAGLSETGETDIEEESLAEIDPEMDIIAQEYFARTATDTRYAVSNPSGYERSTCLLLSRFKDGSSGVAIGTGWLINNEYAVTAGHCLYNFEARDNGNDGWAKHVAIYVGSNNGNKIHYSLNRAYAVGADYKICINEAGYNNFSRWDDWGVVRLKSPVPSSLSISKLTLRATNSINDMQGKTYMTQGYPMDLNQDKGNDMYRYTMYKQNNIKVDIKYDHPYVLDLVGSTNATVFTGQSGSALYSGGYAEAICIGCDWEKEGGPATFILINSWLYNNIRNKYM